MCQITTSLLFKDPFNLVLGSKIKLYVTASSNFGDSVASEIGERLFAFPPLAPLNVESRAVNTNARQIGIYWQPPADTQGAPIEQYKLEWRA